MQLFGQGRQRICDLNAGDRRVDRSHVATNRCPRMRVKGLELARTALQPNHQQRFWLAAAVLFGGPRQLFGKAGEPHAAGRRGRSLQHATPAHSAVAFAAYGCMIFALAHGLCSQRVWLDSVIPGEFRRIEDGPVDVAHGTTATVAFFLQQMLGESG
jgi:hypothetical protein